MRTSACVLETYVRTDYTIYVYNSENGSHLLESELIPKC